MKTTISHKITKRITAWVMMLVLAGGAALAFSTPAHADEDEELANYSFYKLTSSLSAYFSNGQSPAATEEQKVKGDVWAAVLEEPGNAGSMLGYVDKDLSISFEFLNSALSGSSSSTAYDTLTQTAEGTDVKSTGTPGMLDYAHFGATLNAMGLDSMGTGLSLGFVERFAGGVIMLLYVMSGLIDLLFVGIIGTLKVLNPFNLFYAGVKAVSPGFAEGMLGGGDTPVFLKPLATWIGQWYQVLNSLAWTVLVPLFLGTVLLGLFMAKNSNRGSAIKKLVIRVVFIGVGLPLVGSMYTGVLNSMGDASRSGSVGSTQVVLSTYVDFQSWAAKNRLYVPEGAVIEWDATRGEPTGAALSKVRNTALLINQSTNYDFRGIGATLDVRDGDSWTKAAMESAGDNAGGAYAYVATLEVLGRYMSGQKIDGASYESDVKGSLSTSKPYTDGLEGQAEVDDWFVGFGDAKKKLPEITSADVVEGNPVLNIKRGEGLHAHPAGATGGVKKYTSPSTLVRCTAKISDADGNPRSCNMSTLSIYNFLNTSFGSDSMTIYSSTKATSGATREMHNSVTQVGTGLMGALYWLNSVVLLASFVIIGLGYALMMLFSNIKRGFQLVTAIPFATIGAVPGIAKVIIYAAAMILEIVLTLFLYRFIQQFLISIPEILEMPFARIINSGGAGEGVASNLLIGGTLSMAMTTLSIVALIMFTVLSLRVRTTVVKAVQEVVTKLVDKFLDTNIAPSGGGKGLVPAMAGGLASGAGLAAANRAMGGNLDGSGGKKPGAAGGGPSKLQAGGIPAISEDGPAPTGGPAGELTVGGGAGMEISGSEGDAGPDGSGGKPSGQGPDGSGSGGLSGLVGNVDDQAVAKTVEAQGGLSEPGSRGSGDVTDTLAGSAASTQEQYGAMDKAKVDGAVAGGKAVAKGAEAAGRGAVGDAGGAASAGVAAAGHLQDSQAKAEEAKSIKADINSAPPAPTAGMSASGSAKSLDTSESGAAAAGAAQASTAGQKPQAGGSAGAAGKASTSAPKPQAGGSAGAAGKASTSAPKPQAGGSAGAGGKASTSAPKPQAGGSAGAGGKASTSAPKPQAGGSAGAAGKASTSAPKPQAGGSAGAAGKASTSAPKPQAGGSAGAAGKASTSAPKPQAGGSAGAGGKAPTSAPKPQAGSSRPATPASTAGPKQSTGTAGGSAPKASAPKPQASAARPVTPASTAGPKQRTGGSVGSAVTTPRSAAAPQAGSSRPVQTPKPQAASARPNMASRPVQTPKPQAGAARPNMASRPVQTPKPRAGASRPSMASRPAAQAPKPVAGRRGPTTDGNNRYR